MRVIRFVLSLLMIGATFPGVVLAQETPPAVTTPAPPGTPGPQPTAKSTPQIVSSGRLWPAPDTAAAQEHFWLIRPFVAPAEDGIQYWYPYGSTGAGQYLIHHGVDLLNPMGTPIQNVAAGRVVVAGDDLTTAYGMTTKFYGRVVVVELSQRLGDQPVFVLYGHMETIAVTAGQDVKPGDRIGTVGMAGIALGPHLHLEVRVGKNTYDSVRNPDLWLQPFASQGVIAGRLVDENGHTWPQTHILIYKAERRDRILRELYTYVDNPGISPDDAWGENFTIPDLLAGDYLLETKIGSRIMTLPITVKAGKVSFVLWQVNPTALATPTPAPRTPRPTYPPPMRRPLPML